MSKDENHFHSHPGDMAAVIQTAQTAIGFMPMEVPNAVYLPKAAEGRIEDLQRFLPTPRRKAGTITVFDAASFNAMVAENTDAGPATVYVDRDVNSPAIIAVLNDHGLEAGPGWRDFRVQIEFRQTPQWKKWRAMDGKMVGQAEFAEFIEDNIADIAEPVGAEMLEIVTYLQATRTTDFKSGVRLSNGNVQFVNIENTEARVGAGRVEVPEQFKLAITPFQGLPLFAVPAKFRYRLNDGKLTMGLKLERIENLMNQVLNETVSQITSENIIQGKPGA